MSVKRRQFRIGRRRIVLFELVTELRILYRRFLIEVRIRRRQFVFNPHIRHGAQHQSGSSRKSSPPGGYPILELKISRWWRRSNHVRGRAVDPAIAVRQRQGGGLVLYLRALRAISLLQSTFVEVTAANSVWELLKVREDFLRVPTDTEVVTDGGVKGIAAICSSRRASADNLLNLVNAVAGSVAAVEAVTGIHRSSSFGGC